ncbi:unnamed protein product [Pleuronectes platessa]|uniref:Uncharacterized protein n=1 Tax=Pleuronectes platessa TaxID=8262 RepID=A0A9N7TLQ2_PLEPL|nr:unnamed protein product [Pleuronectes platessa]
MSFNLETKAELKPHVPILHTCPLPPHLIFSAGLIRISNTSSGTLISTGVSLRGLACHFSLLVSSSRGVEEEEEEEEEGADKSHSVFHHADFILRRPFDGTGEQNLGGVRRFTSDRSVQAIKGRRSR